MPIGASGRALIGETDPAKRKALFARMLGAYEAGCTSTIVDQLQETYDVKRTVKWTPYSFFFMDLRADHLSFV